MYGEARSVEVEVEGLRGKDFSLRAEGLGVWDGLSQVRATGKIGCSDPFLQRSGPYLGYSQ